MYSFRAYPLIVILSKANSLQLLIKQRFDLSRVIKLQIFHIWCQGQNLEQVRVVTR